MEWTAQVDQADQEAFSCARSGDLEGAFEAWTKASQLLEQHAPRSKRLASTWNLLAKVEKGRGNLAASICLYRKDLALTQSIDPSSVGLAHTLCTLGAALKAQGNLDEARHMCVWLCVRAWVWQQRSLLRIFAETSKDHLLLLLPMALPLPLLLVCLTHACVTPMEWNGTLMHACVCTGMYVHKQ